VGIECELKSGLRVGSAFTAWSAGSIVLFDDSFEHEAWWQWSGNNTDAQQNACELLDRGGGDATCEAQETRRVKSGDNSRVVLLLDLFHPQLDADQLRALKNSLDEGDSATAAAAV
jgi:hypothetical protein